MSHLFSMLTVYSEKGPVYSWKGTVHGVPVVSHPGRFIPTYAVVRSFHTQYFCPHQFIVQISSIIISGKVTKIVHICIIYKISAQKLKYLYVVYKKCPFLRVLLLAED